MLKLPGIDCELNWLFIASFEDGLEVRQTPEDRSVTWTEQEPRSAWYDVVEALKEHQLSRLILQNRLDPNRSLAINFPELTFQSELLVFRAHEGETVYNPRPVYVRRRSCLMNSEDGKLSGHRMIFRIGWQGNLGPDDGSPNIQRIMEIPND